MSATMSRRILINLAAGAAVGTALAAEPAGAQARLSGLSKNEAIVRDYYKAWEKKDWRSFDALVADDFSFSSAAGDHLVGKTVFKKACWDTQIAFIKSFDLELVTAKDDAVVTQYLCHTANGKSFRNVEIARLRNAKIESINCYFGSTSSFPSAVSSQKN